MTAPLSPAVLARLSAGSRSAVEQCGGVDGAAATSGRGRSTAGRWMSRNDPDQPPLDAALAMDQVVVLQGRIPPILSAYARELGHVAIRLPDAPDGSTGWHQSMGTVSSQVGEAMARICTALGDDGAVSAREVATLNIVGEIDGAIEALVAMRAMAVGAV
jgi:hypothetical protein